MRHLRRWLLFIVGASVLAGAVAALWSARRPVLYEATTTIAVNPVDPTPNGLVVAVANARALLESPGLATSTVEKFGLGRPPDSLLPASFLRDRLTVTALPDTPMLRVRVRLSTASLAGQVLSDFVTTARNQNERSIGERVRTSTAPLTLQLDDARQARDHAADNLLAFRKSAQLERIRKEAEVALDERARADRLGVEIEAERSRIAAAQKELSARRPAAETDSGQSVDSLVGETARPVKRGTTDSLTEALTYDVAAGRAKTSALETERRMLTGRKADEPLMQLYDGELQLERLESDYRIADQLYKESAFRYEQSRREAILRTFTMTIGDVSASNSPVSPQVALSGMVGAAVGLVAAAFCLVASAYFPGTGRDGSRA